MPTTNIASLLTLSALSYLDFTNNDVKSYLNGKKDDPLSFTPGKLEELEIKSDLNRQFTPKSENEAKEAGYKWLATWQNDLFKMSDWKIAGVLNDNNVPLGSPINQQVISGFYGVSFFNTKTGELVTRSYVSAKHAAIHPLIVL